MKAIDVNPEDLRTVQRILREQVPELEVRAFGSRVSWTARETSDLDLALMTDRRLPPARMAELRSAFSESDLPFKVDLIDWSETKKRFRRIIEAEYAVVQQGCTKREGEEEVWRELTFAELIDGGVLEVGDGYRAQRSELGGTGPIFLRAGHVRDTHIDFEGVDRFREELAERVASKMSRPGDVIVTTKGNSTGRVAFVDESAPSFVYSPHLSYWRSLDRRTLLPAFLRYWSRGRQFRDQLSGLAQSTDMAPYLSLVDQRRLTITLPPVEVQRAIARVLGKLDDKIELNRRMNEMLEAMARSLFKSWFVDFDPVRAKAEGRAPGLRQPLADLFPDRLVDSEMGEIPEGWRFETLIELIEVNPTRTLRRGETAPYLAMANMPTRCHSPDAVITRAFGSGMRFVNGDTLVARITPCLENGKTAFVDFLKEEEVGWGSMECIVLRPKPPLPLEFAYCLARSSEFRDFAIQRMMGSGGRQRVPAQSLASYRLVVADEPVAEMFGQLIKPLFCRASAAIRESRILAVLRDALLPRLISGELRVKDPERFAEEAQQATA